MTGRLKRLGQLIALYVAQGMPFGFATTFLPIVLAHRPDFSYAKATLIQLAAFPWFLKVLWAPLADTHYLPKLGRRRSWILPAQALLALTALVAARVDFTGPIIVIGAVVVLFNLFASLQDTAVDGLAVELLPSSERGLGNAAQVGGYKAGMLLGGTGLVALAAVTSEPTALRWMAVLIGLLWLVPLTLREPPTDTTTTPLYHHAHVAMRRLLTELRGADWRTTLLFIGTVKLGEAMVGAVLKPWLIREAHFTNTRAAFIVGALGGGASLAASVVGGLLAQRFDRRALIGILGLVQAAGTLLLAVAVRSSVDPTVLSVAIVIQHACVGLLTPVLFAYMMDLCDPAVGATHYTLLATLELLSRSAGSALAGPMSDAMGPPSMMLLAGTVGALPLLLARRLRAPHGGESGLSASS